MLLSELHGYKRYENMSIDGIEDYLKKHGILAATGCFGIVLIPKQKDYVYRIWTNDSGYDAYLSFINKSEHSKYFPKILGKQKKIPMMFKRPNLSTDYLNIIKLEKLDSIKDENVIDVIDYVGLKLGMGKSLKEISDKIGDYFGNDERVNFFQKNQDLWNMFEKMQKYFDNNQESSFDLHSDNVMMRGKEFVITDPATAKGESATLGQIADLLNYSDEPFSTPFVKSGRTSKLNRKE